MIKGWVSSDGAAGLQAWVTIEVAGSDEVFAPTDVIVDTGFTGWLALPGAVIEQMNLDLYGRRPAVLANGETEILDLYFALVQWHGQVRPVMIHQAGGRPLIGMALLSGSRFIVDASEGGAVAITENGDLAETYSPD